MAKQTEFQTLRAQFEAQGHTANESIAMAQSEIKSRPTTTIEQEPSAVTEPVAAPSGVQAEPVDPFAGRAATSLTDEELAEARKVSPKRQDVREEERRRKAEVSPQQVAGIQDPFAAQQMSALQANTEANNEIMQNALAQIDKTFESSDQMSKNILVGIQRDYQNRIRQMEQVNKARAGNINTGLMRSGVSRFAPQLAQGILSSEEASGIKRISDLESQKQSLIMQAVEASQERKFSVLQEKLNLIKQNNDEQRDALILQGQLARDFQQASMARARFEREGQMFEINLLREEQQRLTEEEQAELDLIADDKERLFQLVQRNPLEAEKAGISLDDSFEVGLEKILPELAEAERQKLLPRAPKGGVSTGNPVIIESTPTLSFAEFAEDWMQERQISVPIETLRDEYQSYLNEADSGKTDLVDTWVNLLGKGQANVSNIPQNIRNDVIARVGDTGASINKALSDTAITQMTQLQSAISSLDTLEDVVTKNSQYIGPISGWQKVNPWSKSRQTQAEVDRVRQVVGKALEGGVLRKEDEEKYKKILATLTDTPDTALYKIQSLKNQINIDIANYSKAQRDAGRYVADTKSSDLTTGEARNQYNY